MDRTRIVLFLAAMLTCFLVGSSALAKHPFVNDFVNELKKWRICHEVSQT